MDKGSEVDRPGGLYQVGLRPKEGGGCGLPGRSPGGRVFLLFFVLSFCISFLLLIFSFVLANCLGTKRVL